MSDFPKIDLTKYELFQENGTQYLRSRIVISDNLKTKMNHCSGEIFISGIPSHITTMDMAGIVEKLGDIYLLRFKVSFSGSSRGFAYLQYLNESIVNLALNRLPRLFEDYSLHKIKVVRSKNSSTLLLWNTENLSCKEVFCNLQKLVSFQNLFAHYHTPGKRRPHFQIFFSNNQEAVQARRILLEFLAVFGRKACILWDCEAVHFNCNSPCEKCGKDCGEVVVTSIYECLCK